MRLEHRAGGVVGDVAVAAEFVREAAHVAGALDVVLAPQRVHAGAELADIAGGHGEVRHRHHGGAALAVFGDAEAVIDGAVAAGCEQAGGRAYVSGRDAGQRRRRLWAVARVGDEAGPALERLPFAAFAGVGLVDQALRDDDMGEGVQQGDVGAGQEGEMVVGLDVGRADQVDAAGVGDDQAGAGAEPLLHAGGEDRVAVRGVGADDQDHVGMVDAGEVLGAGGGCRAWSSNRSRWASGRRGRRCRRCCCRRRRG